jgi:polynucleotide 5'-hydroxyl-kinase GRC3/NOL9
MTDRGGSKNNPWSSVMVLDIDPGQPEYSPPGVISLTRLTTPNLSPSFCHPTLAPAEGQLRAHAIASVTPAQDPAHFIECVLDLFRHYQRSPDAKSPLVINTPGWIQGTGLDILIELITSLRPTEVIYTSQDGPEETVSSLQSACTSTSPPITFSTLPSQPTEPSSARTSLHFRTMQTMSYFHLNQPNQQPYPTWDPTPLTDLRPWRVRYTGKDRGFLGILCYDHQPAPELLAEAVNGTILALVKLEDREAALRGLRPPGFFPRSQTDVNTAMDTDMDTTNPLPDTNINSTSLTAMDTASDDDNDNAHQTRHNPHQGHHQQQHERPQSKHQQRNTKHEETDIPLPLIPNPQGLTLSPSHSHLLGLVLVRGIDQVHSELQLLTPLSQQDVEGLSGEDLVLVAGRFDTPSWAYSENLFHARSQRKGAGSSEVGVGAFSAGGDRDGGEGEGFGVEDGSEDEDDDEDDEGEVEGGPEAQGRRTEVPWVEMLHGSQKRAAGSKVWRVRRDLGRG